MSNIFQEGIIVFGVKSSFFDHFKTNQTSHRLGQYTQKIDIPCRNTLRQTRFMIPMAISLGFGVFFATLITLVLVPCFYLAFGDLRFRNAGKLSPAGYIETADHRSSEEV